MEPLPLQNQTLVTPDFLGKQHPYRQCIAEDVEPHFAKIKHWVPEEEHQEFKNRMVACLTAGTAWCTENTFIYYLNENRRIANGYALFGRDFPLELMALFVGTFWAQDRETYHIRFVLHPGKAAEEYKTMITNWSLMQVSKYPHYPLMVNVFKLRKKFSSILHNRTKL